MTVYNSGHSPRRDTSSQLILLVVISLFLLFAGWLRMQHVVDFYEWPDEIWSLWHVRGRFGEAMSRVPYDWPPLYSVIAWVWTQLAGPSLEASRFLMVQFAVLMLTFMYRATRLFYARIAPSATGTRGAAWVALVAAISMAYLIFSSVEVRAYGVALMLGTLALWLTLRWLHQPTRWQRTLILALVLSLLFYSTYTSLFLIAILSLLVIAVHPRLVLRWVLVGALTILFSMLTIPQFASSALGRLDVMAQPPTPFLQAMASLYSLFGGSEVYAALMGVALLIVLFYVARRHLNWRLGLLLVIWVGFPTAIYVLKYNREFLSIRYLWWVALGLVVLLGTAAIYLPRKAQWVAVGLLLGITVLPVDWLRYRPVETEAVPMRMVLSWFAEHIRPGDVVIEDPYCVCGTPIAWDYFLPQYFPQGYLPWATEPGTHSRIWYLATTGWQQDDQLKAEILKGRKESIFVGPWNFLLRLYEGPPLWQGIPFGDEVTLNGFEIPENRTTFHENETVQVKLWWSALKKPTQDYSISLAVFDDGGKLISQDDGPARADGTPSQMSAWEPGQYYEDYRSFTLPVGAPGRDYTLVVTVYDWQTGTRLEPSANSTFELSSVSPDYLLLQRFSVVSY